MNREKIGEVVITYTPEGIAETTAFLATIKIDGDAVAKQLLQIKAGDKEVIKNNSDMVMASWFSRINDIELMDHSDQRLNSEIVDCLKRENGMVYYCRIAYYIENVNHKSSI